MFYFSSMSSGTVTNIGWNMSELGDVIDLEKARKLPTLQTGDVLDAEIDRISNAGNHVIEYGKNHILLTDTISDSGNIGNPGDTVRAVIKEDSRKIAHTVYIHNKQSPQYKSTIEKRVELVKKLTGKAKQRDRRHRKKRKGSQRKRKSNNNIFKKGNKNHLLRGKL